MKIEEDGAVTIPVAGAPLNQTAGVKGPIKRINDKNIFKRVLAIKKKKPHSVV